MNHIIIDKRGNLERFNYIRNIKNKYENEEDNSYKSHRHLVGSAKNQGNLDEKSFTGIKLYTQNDIYSNLNRFLYDTYAKQPTKDMNAYQKWFPIVGWITKSL
jgi:hypothetical protein